MNSADVHYLKEIGSKYTGPLLRSRRRLLLKHITANLSRVIVSILLESGQHGPPFDPTKITRIGLAQVAFAADTEGQQLKWWEQARLVPSEKGFTVLYKPMGRNRDRTNIAHEIAHTLFYDTEVLPPRKLSLDNIVDTSWQEEDICRSLAREMLVPLTYLRNMVTEHSQLGSPSLHNLFTLQNFFVASVDVLAYRLVLDSELWNAIYFKYIPQTAEGGLVFRLERGLKTKKSSALRKVRLSRTIRSSEDHLLYQTLAEGLDKGVARARLHIGTSPLLVETQTISYPTIKGHRVIVGLVSEIPERAPVPENP